MVTTSKLNKFLCPSSWISYQGNSDYFPDRTEGKSKMSFGIFRSLIWCLAFRKEMKKIGRLNMTAITIEHLHKQYGNHQAVQDLSFSINEFGRWIFRSQWSRKIHNDGILTGFIAPSSGTAQFEGSMFLKIQRKRKSKSATFRKMHQFI